MAAVTIEDSAGNPVLLEVSHEVAAVLLAPDPPLREVTFSDCKSGFHDFLSLDLRLYHAGRRSRIDVSLWEGPRLRFGWLVGEGRIWWGPPRGGPCPFCRGDKLPRHAYCLGCDRCGQESLIPRPSRDEVRNCRAAERARREKRSRLKGGMG